MTTNFEVKNIALEELNSDADSGAMPLVPLKMDLVGHVPVSVSVSIGTLEISVNKLFSLKPGETLKLNEHVDTPITLLVDKKPVAYGNLVVVDDCFGVQITNVAEQ